MSKKAESARAYFREVLRGLSGREFDTVVRHLQNRHGVNFARYPGRLDVARSLAERDDGAQLLSEAVSEVEASEDALARLEELTADVQLDRLSRIGEE